MVTLVTAALPGVLTLVESSNITSDDSHAAVDMANAFFSIPVS